MDKHGGKERRSCAFNLPYQTAVQGEGLRDETLRTGVHHDFHPQGDNPLNLFHLSID
jgi:hypothetical protein